VHLNFLLEKLYIIVTVYEKKDSLVWNDIILNSLTGKIYYFLNNITLDNCICLIKFGSYLTPEILQLFFYLC